MLNPVQYLNELRKNSRIKTAISKARHTVGEDAGGFVPDCDAAAESLCDALRSFNPNKLYVISITGSPFRHRTYGETVMHKAVEVNGHVFDLHFQGSSLNGYLSKAFDNPKDLKADYGQ